MARAWTRRLRGAAGRSVASLAPWLLGLAPVALGVALCLSRLPVVDHLRDLVFDNYQVLRPRPWRGDLPVRVVDVDEESLAQLGQWPWPRTRLAELAARLDALGAAAVGFDTVFAETDQASPESLVRSLPQSPERDALLASLPSGEAAFATALKGSRSVLAAFLNDDGRARELPAKAGVAEGGDDPRLFLPRFERATPPLPALTDGAAGLGAVDILSSRDLVVRQVPLFFSLGTTGKAALVPSFDAELLRIAQGASTYVIKSSNASGEGGWGAPTGVVAVKIGDLEVPTEADGSVRVRYAGFQPGRRIPAWRVLAGKVSKEDIEGRIAIVGVSAAGLNDLKATPLQGGVPGDEIHAEVLEHILSGQRLARPDYAPGLEAFATLIGGLLAVVVARRLAPLAATLAVLALTAGVATASFLAFSRADLLVDPLVPGATVLATYGLVTIAVYRRTERERRFVRTAFSRYLAPSVVERLARYPGTLQLGGELRTVTILVADARDFTRRSERRSAQGVVTFLNRLLTPLTAAVQAERGTIDKYLGDGLMAFWNAPLDVPDHADRACRAAMAMLASLPDVDAAEHKAAEEEGRPHIPVRIGIGINTGDVFVGNMGSLMRFDYSIAGDPVNVTARLETATKEYGLPVIVSEATVQAARAFRFVDLGEAALKGKAGAARLYALHGPHGAADAAAFEDFRVLHDAALAAVRANRRDAAEALARVRSHPLAARYEAVYRRILDGIETVVR